MKRQSFQEFLERREKWISPEKAAIASMKAVLNPFAGQRRNPVKAAPNPLSPVSARPPRLP